MSQRKFEPTDAGETVVSLTSSVSWQAAIGRELTIATPPRAHRTCLDFNQLAAMARQDRPTIVIIEITENNFAPCTRWAAEHLDVDGLLVIGVGEWANAELRQGLSHLGITAFYRSFLDFERLATCVERFFANASAAEATIEQRVESGLPWTAWASTTK